MHEIDCVLFVHLLSTLHPTHCQSVCTTYIFLQAPVTAVSPDGDSDSDDEWNMLGRREMGSKVQHSPHRDEPAQV